MLPSGANYGEAPGVDQVTVGLAPMRKVKTR